MSIMTIVVAIFVTAALLSIVVLSVFMGRLSVLRGKPRRVWTGPAPAQPFVEFVPNNGKGGFRVAVSRLGGPGLTIGRDPKACDLVIRDWYVSARHARIWLDSQGLHIEDLKSTNGSWQNDRRVEQATFKFGDPIRLGRTSFRLLAIDG